MLKLHINMLAPHVDQFIIIEANTTFSGKKKPLYFNRDRHLVKEHKNKILYHIIDENYSDKERDQARLSPNTMGASHWQTEFLQKESIKKALLHLKPDDTCYIGDVDEIWDPNYKFTVPIKLRLKVYTYYLNNLSNEQFWGTFVAPYQFIKYRCLNALRTDTTYQSKDYGGWHFTSMGGYRELKRKLDDSYTKESYNTNEVQKNLKNNIKNNKDFLGRNFIYKKDESEWPQYLKDHKKEYYHLFLKSQ